METFAPEMFLFLHRQIESGHICAADSLPGQERSHLGFMTVRFHCWGSQREEHEERRKSETDKTKKIQ